MSSQERGDGRNRRWALRVRATQILARSREAGLDLPDSIVSSPNRSSLPLNIFGLIPNTVCDNPELINSSCEECGDVEPCDQEQIEKLADPDGREDAVEGPHIQFPPLPVEPDEAVILSLESDSDDDNPVINSPDLHLQVQSQDGEPNEATSAVETGEKYQCSLLFYLDIMYHMCVWPCDIKKKDRPWMLKRLHQILYWMCTFLSFIMILRITKHYTMRFLAGDGELEKFVAMACYMVQGIAKLYFIWLYTMHYDKLVSIVNKLAQMEYAYEDVGKINRANQIVGTALGIAAIMLSLLYCFFWLYTVDTWSLGEILRTHAYVLGELVLTWRPTSYINSTDTLLDTLFVQETNSTKWELIGIPGVLITFCGRLQDSVVCDVVLLMAISLYQAMMNFTHTLSKNEGKESQREDSWCQYECMKSLTQQINDLLGCMFIIFHFYNALTISYFLLEGLKQERKVKTILLGITAAKVTLIYIIASKTSHQNKKIKQWVKDLYVDSCKVEIGGRKRNINVLLDDVLENRIGLGADEFFIDQKFVITFYTAVGTFFMMLAEFREKQNQ